MTEDQLKAVHKHCFNNKEEVEKSTVVACFHCISMWDEEELKETEFDYPSKDPTAFCPKCGIDAIIGNASGIDLYDGEQFDMAEMNIRWFGYKKPEDLYVDLDPENDTDLEEW